MKNFFIFFSFACCFFLISSIGLSAQTIELYDSNPNFTIPVNGDMQKLKLKIRNKSDISHKYRVRLDNSMRPQTHESSFCFGAACYGPNTTESDPVEGIITLAPGAIDNTFIIDYYTNNDATPSSIMVTFFNNDFNEDKLEVTVNINQPTSVETPAVEVRSIFPNPASTSALVRLPEALTNQSDVIVVNSLGQEVLRLNVPISSTEFTIPVQTLPQGTYRWIIGRNTNSQYNGTLSVIR